MRIHDYIYGIQVLLTRFIKIIKTNWDIEIAKKCKFL